MTWDDVLESYANLGWVYIGRGGVQSDDLGIGNQKLSADTRGAENSQHWNYRGVPVPHGDTEKNGSRNIETQH
jgi:hypothetical protein